VTLQRLPDRRPERAARLEGLGVANADLTPNVPILSGVLLEQFGLRAAEHRFLGLQRVQLARVHVGDVHGEIKRRPSRLHPAVPEEQPFNFMRTRSVKDFTFR
jgi:hypothetical protein